jgi:hypothetical protein
MDMRSFPSSLEIAFWSVVISLLSDSELFQNFVQKCYDCFASGRFAHYLRLGVLFSAAGFLLGIVLGLAGV